MQAGGAAMKDNIPAEGYFPQEFEREEGEISELFTNIPSPTFPSFSDAADSDMSDVGEVLPDSPESPPPHERGRHPSTFIMPMPHSFLPDPDSPESPVRFFIFFIYFFYIYIRKSHIFIYIYI